MNATLQVIHHRRSIRKYKSEQIAEDELQAILDAAIMAPSATNQQKWHYTVIQNRPLLETMVQVIKQNILNANFGYLAERAAAPEYDTFYHAPTVILISAQDQARFVQLDCGAAAQNICLAAEALGIGSVIIASSAFLFESEKGNALKRELGVPDGYAHICCVALGYPAAEYPAAPARNRNVINYVR